MGTTTVPAAAGEQLEIAIPEAATRLGLVYIPRHLIHPDPDQPRKDADDELRASIARDGILQPVTVRPHPEIMGDFMLIDGERRWRGSEGIQPELPAIVREDKGDAFQRLATQLIANSGKPLTPMEEARAYAQLMEAQPEISLGDLAKVVGKPRSTVGDRLTLLQLGPWTALIESGKVPVSFATRFLAPLKNVADACHQKAVEIATKNDEINPDMDAERFRGLVRDLYNDFLYPLTKIKNGYANPTFDTKEHDQECDCGRIVWSEFDEDRLRDYCGNPEWWKPLDKAAKAKAKKEAKSAPRSSAPSKPKGPRLALPDGVAVKDIGYSSTPNDVVELASGTTWDGSGDVMEAKYFDRSTLAIDDKKLKAFSSPYSGTRVCYPAGDNAVKVAREAWAKRRSDAITAAREKLEAIVAKKSKQHALAGKGAPAILSAVVANGAGRDGIRIDDAAAIAGIEIPEKFFKGDSWNLNARLASWAADLSEKHASQLLTIVAIVLAENLTWPAEEARASLERVAANIAKKPHPWLAKGKGKASATSAKDGDEGDDEGGDE